MKAKTEFLVNSKEIEQALKLDISPPEPEFKNVDFTFDLNAVAAYYINSDGNINISLYGELWTLIYNKRVIAELERYLNR
ncbi:MAG: hypothetical protein OEM04_00950 [Flavobacteriaceae bacterium]|jgi:hypothetical protein|nr:hypothetical protein [Flavobacteriaceae bacterium]